MNYAFVPDLVALTILVVILTVLRLRHPQQRANLWLLGLFFTLIEATAHTFYAQNGLPAKVLHVIVLDCYLIAGMVFVWASGDFPISSGTRLFYLWMNALPLLAINTIYGLHIFKANAYFPFIAAGIVIGTVSSLYLRRSWILAVLYVSGWMSMGYLIRNAEYRNAVYWSLCCVYAIAALNFQRRLPRNSTGKLAIVTGFTIWSLCFLVHPWIVTYRAYADIVSHVWNMQKSLISIGMILVMLEEQISCNEWLALHDELTGLPNRRLFADRLTTALGQSQRTRSRLAIVILDLDQFKTINDTLGHQAGDQVLREVAGNLRSGIRTNDTLARLGGDEFILVATDVDKEQAVEHFVETVQRALEKPILVDEQAMVISASLGLAIYPDDATDSIRLLQIADKRMYALKTRPQRVTGKATAGSLAGYLQ
jgi:diguanylate cyclase (GGDEF)-like protein